MSSVDGDGEFEEFYEGPPEPDWDALEDMFIPDPDKPEPSFIAQLDQEQAALNNSSLFKDVYGFAHNCHCSQDYTEGKTVQMSECYAAMAEDALATCAAMKEKYDELRAGVQMLADFMNG